MQIIQHTSNLSNNPISFDDDFSVSFGLQQKEAQIKWEQIAKQSQVNYLNASSNNYQQQQEKELNTSRIQSCITQQHVDTQLKQFQMDGTLAPQRCLSKIERILYQDKPSNLFQFSQFLSTHYTTREKIITCKFNPQSHLFNFMKGNEQIKKLPLDKKDREAKGNIIIQKENSLSKCKKRRQQKQKNDSMNIFLCPIPPITPESQSVNYKIGNLQASLSPLPARQIKRRPKTTPLRFRYSKTEDRNQTLNLNNPFQNHQVQHQPEPKGNPFAAIKYQKQRFDVSLTSRQDVQLVEPEADQRSESVLFPLEPRKPDLTLKMQRQFVKIKQILGKESSKLIPNSIESMKNQTTDLYEVYRGQGQIKQLTFREFSSESARAQSTYSQRKKKFEEQIKLKLEKTTEERSIKNKIKLEELRKDIDNFKSFEDLRGISSVLNDRLKILEIQQFKRKNKG